MHATEVIFCHLWYIYKVGFIAQALKHMERRQEIRGGKKKTKKEKTPSEKAEARWTRNGSCIVEGGLGSAVGFRSCCKFRSSIGGKEQKALWQWEIKRACQQVRSKIRTALHSRVWRAGWSLTFISVRPHGGQSKGNSSFRFLLTARHLTRVVCAHGLSSLSLYNLF